MLTIASDSGIPTQTRLRELTTLPQNPLVAKGFLPWAIAASRIRRSQFDLLARSDRHLSFYISIFSLQTSLTQFLNPLSHMWSVEMTRYEYFCILSNQWRRPGAEFGGTEKFFADQDF